MFKYKDYIIGTTINDEKLITFIKDKSGKYEMHVLSKKYYGFYYKNNSPFVMAKTTGNDYVILFFNEKKMRFDKVTKKFDKEFFNVNMKFINRDTNVIIGSGEIYYFDSKKNKVRLLLKKYDEYMTNEGNYALIHDGDNKFHIINLKTGELKPLPNIKYINDFQIFDKNSKYKNKIIFDVSHEDNKRSILLFDTESGNVNTLLNVNKNDTITFRDNIISVNHREYLINRKNNNLIKITNNNEDRNTDSEYMIYSSINNDLMLKLHTKDGKYEVFSVDHDNNKLIKLKNSDILNMISLYDIRSNNRDIIIGYKGNKSYIFKINKDKNKIELVSDNLPLMIENSVNKFTKNKSNYLVDKNLNIYYYDEETNKITKVVDKHIIGDNNVAKIVNGDKDNGMLILYNKNNAMHIGARVSIDTFIYHLNKSNVNYITNKKVSGYGDITRKMGKKLYKNDSILVTDLGIITNYKSNDIKFILPHGTESNISFIKNTDNFLISYPSIYNEKITVFPNYNTTNKNLEKYIKLDHDSSYVRNNIFIESGYKIIEINPDTYKEKVLMKSNWGNINKKMVIRGLSDYLINDKCIFHVPTKMAIKRKTNVSSRSDRLRFSILNINGREIQLRNEPIDYLINFLANEILSSIC